MWRYDDDDDLSDWDLPDILKRLPDGPSPNSKLVFIATGVSPTDHKRSAPTTATGDVPVATTPDADDTNEMSSSSSDDDESSGNSDATAAGDAGADLAERRGLVSSPVTPVDASATSSVAAKEINAPAIASRCATCIAG